MSTKRARPEMLLPPSGIHSFVKVGCPGRPFATADPGLDDLLPANDIAWDRGVGRNVPGGFTIYL